ncbi:MAG: hypothetical protein GX416_13495 [Bacteroidales bacterium]|nr:hypothetical protein [Bacteroidales bacterium]
MIDKSTINGALDRIDNSMSVTYLYIKKDFSAINKANEKVLHYIFESIQCYLVNTGKTDGQ